MKFRYDLHLHSCLSPCADNENTPGVLAGIGKLNGLQVMALTDHNTAKNCPAFFAAAEAYGVVPVAGMELTTAEDIHLVCLFPDLQSALAFDGAVEAKRVRIPNRTDIFGEQWLCNTEDEPIGQEPDLLSNATLLSLDEAFDLAVSFGGIGYPAHIDRESNGILATLGFLPERPAFSCVEFHHAEKIAAYRGRLFPAQLPALVCSDAHCLSDLREDSDALELFPADDSPEAIRAELFRYLKGEAPYERAVP